MIKRETKHPRAYEVMDAVLKRGDAKELARRLSRSPQGIRNWAREPETNEDYTATGRFSPLDWLREIINLVKEEDGGRATRAYPIGHYIANLLQGVFVPLPPVASSNDSQMLERVSQVLKETGEAVNKTRESWCESTPGKMTPQEASMSRKEIDEAIIALQQLRQWVDQVEGEDR